MPELTLLIDETAGAMLFEHSRLPATVLSEMVALAGEGKECGCARQLEILPPPMTSKEEQAKNICVQIAGYYHNSLMEGPGRRSSVLFQFCPLACKGCWVPHLHSSGGGELVPVGTLAEKLLDPTYERDGVSILGGEPFAQAEGLLALIRELRRRGCRHILCYSGYKLGAMMEKAR
jgi:4Fe-4S single cluster domain/Radical SAM superfamily